MSLEAIVGGSDNLDGIADRECEKIESSVFMTDEIPP